jgi:hypothetical protein
MAMAAAAAAKLSTAYKLKKRNLGVATNSGERHLAGA